MFLSAAGGAEAALRPIQRLPRKLASVELSPPLWRESTHRTMQNANPKVGVLWSALSV